MKLDKARQFLGGRAGDNRGGEQEREARRAFARHPSAQPGDNRNAGAGDAGNSAMAWAAPMEMASPVLVSSSPRRSRALRSAHHISSPTAIIATPIKTGLRRFSSIAWWKKKPASPDGIVLTTIYQNRRRR